MHSTGRQRGSARSWGATTHLQRQVLRFEAGEVAEHLRLRVVRIEDGVGEEIRCAGEVAERAALRDTRSELRQCGVASVRAERAENLRNVLLRRRLVQREANGALLILVKDVRGTASQPVSMNRTKCNGK